MICSCLRFECQTTERSRDIRNKLATWGKERKKETADCSRLHAADWLRPHLRLSLKEQDVEKETKTVQSHEKQCVYILSCNYYGDLLFFDILILECFQQDGKEGRMMS